MPFNESDTCRGTLQPGGAGALYKPKHPPGPRGNGGDAENSPNSLAASASGVVDDLESRLAAQIEFEESKQLMLEGLLAENEDLRKQNSSLEMENRRLKHTLDLDSRRHKELLASDAQDRDRYPMVITARSGC